jgi:hypothetical protein
MEKLTIRGLVLAVSLLGGVAHADAKLDEAKAHLATGTQLYDENNFRGALVEFQRAYELAPSYKILFNIAQVAMELQDYAGALKAYTRYLAEGGPDVPADRVAQTTAEIDRLKGRVGRLTIVTVAGAEILLDDTPVGFAPLPEPVPVNAGQHKVTVHVTGRDPVSRVYDIAGRQEVTAAVGNDAPPVVTTVPAATLPPRPEPRAPKSKTPAYVAIGITGGLAITAGVFALVTRHEEGDLDSLRNRFPVTTQELDDQRSLVKRDALLTDIFTGAAVISAGFAIYLSVTRLGSTEAPDPGTHVQLGISPSGIAIAGAF